MIVVYVIWNKKSQLLRRTLPIAYTDPGDGHTMQVSLLMEKWAHAICQESMSFCWGVGVEGRGRGMALKNAKPVSYNYKLWELKKH